MADHAGSTPHSLVCGIWWTDPVAANHGRWCTRFLPCASSTGTKDASEEAKVRNRTTRPIRVQADIIGRLILSGSRNEHSTGG